MDDMLIVLTAIVTICLSLGIIAIARINVSRQDRSVQIIIPVFAFVYSIAAVFLIKVVTEIAKTVVSGIASGLSWLSAVSFIPMGISNAFYSASDSMNEIAASDDNMGNFLFANIGLLIIYIILKTAIIRILNSINKADPYALEGLRGILYEYDADDGVWYLKNECVQARKMMKALMILAVVFTMIVMIASIYMYYSNITESFFYPLYCILLVSELFFLMDGISRQDFSDNVSAEEEESERIINSAALRRALKDTFEDKLLSDGIESNISSVDDTTSDEVIRAFEADSNPAINNLAEFIKTSMGSLQMDTNYLYSMKKLVEGRSILFNNPFYRDLIPYAFYPMNRTLLSHKKVLVVLGRHAIEDDIEKWLQDGIESVAQFSFMWNIGKLDKASRDLDIGIITRSDVYNSAIHESNRDFLSEVEFVVIIEPSKLISTAQIGLNLLVKKIKGREDKNITYCICEKNCDGLVDAMSHILMTNITEVAATRKHNGSSTYMCWETDQEYTHHRIVPGIARYLGFGTDLSLMALKKRAPMVRWYGGEAFPVTDMRWIVKQYYHSLMNYAEMPPNQDAMDGHFETSPNLWSAEISEDNFITVEDESFNMFEMIREFSTRATHEGFINVISPDYLLKEYMAQNHDIFINDAKAIPAIVADYVRSSRNTTLRLLLMMSQSPVEEEVIENELALLGIPVFDLKKQLWFEIFKCFAPVGEIRKLSSDYKEAVGQVSQMEVNGSFHRFSSEILVEEREYSFNKGTDVRVYSITDKAFLNSCIRDLRSAVYIAEDEDDESNYMGAELIDHIYSKYLPGQMLTFAGKYYEMLYLTAEGNVLLRRAADHINGRPSYRQIREYKVKDIQPSTVVGSSRIVDGIRVSRQYVDLEVNTAGYFRMNQYGDFSTAKRIMFADETSRIPLKSYVNKEALVIDLPDDVGLTDEVRFTITLMMNEVFRTLFAENQPYISAVTDCSFIDDYNSMPLTYTLVNDPDEGSCAGATISSESDRKVNGRIFIFEDSQLDMGLINAVDRNLQRIMGIICDYLEWHSKAMLETDGNEAEDIETEIVFTPGEIVSTKKKRKGIRGIIDRIREGLKLRLGKKRREDDETDVYVDGESRPVDDGEIVAAVDAVDTAEVVEEAAEEASTEAAESETVESEDSETAESAEITESSEASDAGNPEDEITFEADGAEKTKPEEHDRTRIGHRLPYKDRYFMLYGFENQPEGIELTATHSYLKKKGFDDSQLRQARDGRNAAREIEKTYRPDKPGVKYCDFCGREITGMTFDTLKDGRDRCMDCGKTAIKTEKAFKEVFEDVKRNMESMYGIRFTAPIKVQMVNAKKIHKKCGASFVPTDGPDSRILGVAIHSRNGFDLLVENGAPKMSTILTMAHELTHIWQYLKWDRKAIVKTYGPLENQVYEGMAEWAKVQYAYLIGEPEHAKREEIMGVFRNDDYGHGLLRYMANYPISEETELKGDTPFEHLEMPLDKKYCTGIPRNPILEETKE